uniref:Uncharacterized protein SAML0260 n=1 Tax=Streptomyces ambofaciens (strain ATCC 23877 / 3486 / DSM 40053 / JCM 4204 / NBRC 12836 / NRRL B-2516) TaxID=278992 RepID=Q1RR99_STRA7|nr:conserved hypothetical protein [Streptomyces ambofaciens ATCC 23877]CAJ89247.1 conserved hypothetical protein [Streptomyces ambofaciens ATCC 23877]
MITTNGRVNDPAVTVARQQRLHDVDRQALAGPAVSGEARCGARPLAILTTVMIGEGGT